MDDAQVKFNIFDFKFTPLNRNAKSKNSLSILKEAIQHINDEKTQKQKAIVIDRHDNREGTESRNIFISSAAYLLKDKIFKCRIALIREHKIPTLVNRTTYSLTSFDELGDKAIAETTNFYIDVSGDIPVVCCEFNNNGPRILDIEYYFRYITSHSMLKISKACKASLHMDSSVSNVLDSITDVLKFRIKTKPNRLSYLYQEVEDPFISNLNALANTVSPNSLKIEASFRDISKSSGQSKNIPAVNLIKRVLSAIKNDSNVTEEFDDFYVEYEGEGGIEDSFNLLKGKKEIIITCSYKSPGNYNTKELYDFTKIEFAKYLQERIFEKP
ncbi:hypothetical protein LCGC14_0265990 [marine sediment metagenome]|uniref:Uncharacterized protein n=1 Tax=marine sediment metagenome TaxID=412755 RepID=A0A0F9WKT7_9ZZZZ|nr:hypothetical protein [Maribacter sp.]HDZ03513.1 hypothetical protein [Maribacter sp.]HEA79454.1 hypothetical protein [Maribacter sp.]